MLNFAPTFRSILGAGFVGTSDTLTLFTHPMWPGMLFKKASTVHEAMACGGVLVVGPDRHIGYLGLAARNAYHGDDFGVTLVPDYCPFSPIGSVLGYSPSGDVLRQGMRVHTRWKKRVEVSDGFALGVVTRASDGHFVGLTTNTTELLQSNIVSHPSDGYVQNGNSLDNVPVGVWTFHVPMLNTGVLCFRRARYSGYVSLGAVVNSAGFFERGRETFLDGSSGQVRDSVAAAFDRQLDLIKDDAVYVGTDLHLAGTGVWSSAPATGQARSYTMLDADFFALRKGPRLTGSAAAAFPVSHLQKVVNCRPYGLGDMRAPTTVLPALEWSAFRGGTADVTRTLDVATTIDTSNSFDPTNTTFATVKTISGQSVPTSRFVGSIFLQSKPSVAPLVGELDCSFGLLRQGSRLLSPSGSVGALIPTSGTILADTDSALSASGTIDVNRGTGSMYLSDMAGQAEDFILAVRAAAKASIL